MKGMIDSEYQSCIDGLGLLEGEEIRLQYVCWLTIWQKRESVFASGLKHKGLLVFTNDNLIFMQQEGFFSSKYGERLRIPIENISGVICMKGLSAPIGGGLKIVIGTTGHTEEYIFFKFESGKKVDEAREEIQKLLKDARQEKKRLAQEALRRGAAPAMIFCKFCGGKKQIRPVSLCKLWCSINLKIARSLIREFERRPDQGFMVARDSFKLSLRTFRGYYQFVSRK
jgi:hypothetical protein